MRMALIVLVLASLLSLRGGDVVLHAGGRGSPSSSLYPSDSERFGVGVNRSFGEIGEYDVAQLKAGWYTDWSTRALPAHPAGLDYVHVIRLQGEAFSPSEETLLPIVAANPGATWIVGNEPDCIWQDNSTPQQYARVYHRLYHFLKGHDPTCQVTIGGIVQATPLRLQWLDAVLAEYLARYGRKLPVDLWNIHTFILREERLSWGAEIPPGISATRGMLWGIEDHDSQALFAQQVVRFRQWMQDRGERDKALIVTEYGILLSDFYGFDTERVQAFMRYTFDYFMTAIDPDLGCPADGNRLVQRWAWYSLNDKQFEEYTSRSHLFDPDTKEMTPLGVEFAAYVAPLWRSYVDLVPAWISFSPDLGWSPESLPVTVTLTAAVRNAGNVDIGDGVTVQFWVGSSAYPIGQEQVIDGLRARTSAFASIRWTGVPVGGYVVGVTVDGRNSVAELDEGNNQFTRTWLMARQRCFLPFVRER